MCNYIITDFPAFVKSKAERIISETRIDVKWVCFISVEARLRKFSAENSEGKSVLKSPQKPLGRAPLKLPKSCLTHLKHTHKFWQNNFTTFTGIKQVRAEEVAVSLSLDLVAAIKSNDLAKLGCCFVCLERRRLTGSCHCSPG